MLIALNIERNVKMIKNLYQLRKCLTDGIQIEIVEHWMPNCVGQKRKISSVNMEGFYSVVPNNPLINLSTTNNGQGYWCPWGKAAYWEFKNGICSLYRDEKHLDEYLVIRFKILKQNNEQNGGASFNSGLGCFTACSIQ